jgi:hypothetical protein
MNMRLSTTLALCSAYLLCVVPASSQPPDLSNVTPTLTARLEVDEHEHCFAVRFFLKNYTDRDVEVEYGRGRSGLEVVPTFSLIAPLSDIWAIHPPTYLRPAHRSLEPDLLRIRAGKEVLYGTFTMGYPRLGDPWLKQRDEKELKLGGYIRFRGFDSALNAEPVRLKVPPQPPAGKATVTDDHHPQDAGSPGQWVQSNDAKLSIRLRVKSPRITAKENISLIAQIRNNTTGPVTILRPFGELVAEGYYLKIWGKDGRLEFTGPELDYDLDASAFVTLGAGEIVTDTLEVTTDFFAGLDQAGTYTLRFDYRYDGVWDEKVAREGVKDIWRGWICTREIQIVKE